MNRVFLALLLCVLAAPAALEPAIPYFTNVREVHIAQPGQQNYFVVDEEIWNHARPDLSDLRLYDGDAQMQFALSEQRAATSSEQIAVKILNLGRVAGHTEFDLDVGQIAEYDRIRLSLDAKNFVVTASVTGSNTLGSRGGAELPPSTLYDFTREDLGSNSVLKLPPSSFHYLHVKLSGEISPQQVKGAAVYNLQEKKASWTSVGSCGPATRNQRSTVITCEAPARVPLDRIMSEIAPGQVNFRRAVSVTDGPELAAGNGEITRVRMNRAGTIVISEEMAVAVVGRSSGRLTVTIDNGDNPALAITRLQPQSLERRVYFDPQGRSSLKLYYGDEKLPTPQYDYARFFKADSAADLADLGPGAHNNAYRGRPDDRPWSERHKALLWVAMLLAVAVLAALAVRGLKTEAAR